SAHPAKIAVVRILLARCLERNSCRSFISTLDGACASHVAVRNTPNASRASSQDSCSAAQRAQLLTCSLAAARSADSAPLSVLPRSGSSPIASNSSHFIATHPVPLPLPRRAHSSRHV